MCVQYIGGIPWVHRGDTMSTSGGYHEYIGDVQYIGGYHDECGGTMSTSGDVQYIGGIPWVHRGDIMSTSGDVQYIGGISWYMWGSNLIKSFQFLLKTPMHWTSPSVLMISPRCTHDIPRCTHGFPRCTEHPPMYSWYPPTCIMIPPDVLNIPRCTHDIPPMHSWYPPDVLMVSLRRTEHPPMHSWYPSDALNPLMYSWYPPWCTHDIPPDVLMIPPRCTHDIPPMYSWYPPDVLNTHYTGWWSWVRSELVEQGWTFLVKADSRGVCLLQEIIGDLPAVNNNDKFLVKFRSGTLRIIGTVKLMSLMSLFWIIALTPGGIRLNSLTKVLQNTDIFNVWDLLMRKESQLY